MCSDSNPEGRYPRKSGGAANGRGAPGARAGGAALQSTWPENGCFLQPTWRRTAVEPEEEEMR